MRYHRHKIIVDSLTCFQSTSSTCTCVCKRCFQQETFRQGQQSYLSLEMIDSLCIFKLLCWLGQSWPTAGKAYRAGSRGQDIDWEGTFWGVLNVSLCASDAQLKNKLTWKTNLEPWITIKTPGIIKSQPGTLNNQKNPHGIIITHLNPWKTNLKQKKTWKPTRNYE